MKIPAPYEPSIAVEFLMLPQGVEGHTLIAGGNL